MGGRFECERSECGSTVISVYNLNINDHTSRYNFLYEDLKSELRFRDPRQRLLAEQKQNSTPKVPGPEKLSFKEKMKMFAMETGEDGTPRDKVKISRAQRDIDNISSPVNNI